MRQVSNFRFGTEFTIIFPQKTDIRKLQSGPIMQTPNYPVYDDNIKILKNSPIVQSNTLFFFVNEKICSVFSYFPIGKNEKTEPRVLASALTLAPNPVPHPHPPFCGFRLPRVGPSP